MRSASSALLNIYGLSKSYNGHSYAIDDVSFDVGRGELVVIIGSSGAGKSTLLRCINCLIRSSKGQIEFDGKEISSMRGGELRRNRRRIGMVFQHYNLVDRASAIENVLHGRLGYKSSLAGALNYYSEKEKLSAFDALEHVGMAEYAYVSVSQLSGGQKQRVGIARSLAQNPLLMLADEPIASLDPKSSHTVMDQLRKVVDEFNVASLVSLHQVDYALEYADRIIGLSEGHVCCVARPDELNSKMIERVYEGDKSISIMGEDN
ncbi:MAG: phosphonate ABC transporter ATP-binding protein [Oscillospiraceae bacterium]|nr:phosphonate ABC transporter ATP-binding protein [Oscillospiraceae bacterium]